MARNTRPGRAIVIVGLVAFASLAQEQAELIGPYEDRLQQEIPFGRRSYFLSPWRAYMDTWPADVPRRDRLGWAALR